MTSLAFQNNLGQSQGLRGPEKTLLNHPWILDYEKLNLPAYRIFGDPITRHHPHGRRVRHINGLLDMPICAVFDYSPPITTNRTAAETTRVENDGPTDGRVPVKQKGLSCSSSLRRLRKALSHGSRIQANIGDGFKPHLGDLQRLPTLAPWREALRSLVASLGLTSLHPDDDSRKRPDRDQTHDRPRTNSSVQALGTVRRGGPCRPMARGSGTEKLPPLRVLYPRLLEGYNLPWFLRRTGTSRGLPIAKCQAASTTRPHCYSEATGRLIPPASRATTRGFSSGAVGKREGFRLGGGPSVKTEEEEVEELVVGILCQLLETDDLNTVRAWLTTAPDSEKAIVLDLVRAALIGKASFDETRRDIVTSDFKDHSRTSGTQPGGSNEAPCGTMATGDGGWTDQKAGGNGFRQTGRVDRLVLDHSQPQIRTNLVTCFGQEENGQERPRRRTYEGQ